MTKLEWLDENKYEVVGPSEDTVSPTNDSEDWLDAAIEEALPKALRVVYSSNLKRKLLKDAILAHYARPTKAQLELAAKVATLEQKIYMMESTYLKPEDVEREFKRGQRVGQYQAADRLYSHVTTMWIFKEDADPKLQMPERANDMLKDCEKYMNHNRKVYNEYTAQLSKLNREEKKDAKT